MFTELKNLNFYVTYNTYVKVEINKLNILLSTYRYKEIDEADEINLKFNKQEDNELHNDENKLKHKCQLYIPSLIILCCRVFIGKIKC